jgi:hypothetical protein
MLLVCATLFFPTGEATIRHQAGPSDIAITTTSRLAGAVHSLTWHGEEFIDSLDHGRQLQSASSFDCGLKPFWAECYNPTEAGSRKDHVGPRSTSRLLGMTIQSESLETVSQMAFWLNPGEKSSGHPAKNTKALSDHLLRKKITLNYRNLAHAIEYDVTFTVPNEQHTLAQFEAVTGYMPPKFSEFFTFNLQSRQLQPIDAGPGEQKHPLIFSTKSGSHAMGVLALEAPENARGPGYGRWNFEKEKVVKWNAVYRVRNDRGVPPGDYRFRLAVIVGSLENVQVTMNQLLK